MMLKEKTGEQWRILFRDFLEGAGHPPLEPFEQAVAEDLAEDVPAEAADGLILFALTAMISGLTDHWLSHADSPALKEIVETCHRHGLDWATQKCEHGH